MVIFLMHILSKSVFKVKMLEYLRQVEQTGEEIVLTNHGEPSVRIVPYQPLYDVDKVVGDLRGKSSGLDVALETTTEEWNET